MPGLLAAVLAAASFAVAVQSCGDHRGPTYTGFDAGSRQLDGEIEFHLSNRAVGGGIITPDAAAAHHALLATWRPIPDGAAPPLRALGFLEMKSQAGLLTFRKSAIAGSAAELGCRAAPEGVTPSGDHSSLKFHCGAAASSVRFKQALRRFGGTPQGPLGNAYSGSALTVSNLNGAFVAGALPGSPHCTSKEGCGQTCNFVQGQLKCEDNIKSGSGSGSGSR